MILRMVEIMFRTLNNMLGKLGRSDWVYLIVGPEMFISIPKLIPLIALPCAALAIEGFIKSFNSLKTIEWMQGLDSLYMIGCISTANIYLSQWIDNILVSIFLMLSFCAICIYFFNRPPFKRSKDLCLLASLSRIILAIALTILSTWNFGTAAFLALPCALFCTWIAQSYILVSRVGIFLMIFIIEAIMKTNENNLLTVIQITMAFTAMADYFM